MIVLFLWCDRSEFIAIKVTQNTSILFIMKNTLCLFDVKLTFNYIGCGCIRGCAYVYILLHTRSVWYSLIYIFYTSKAMRLLVELNMCEINTYLRKGRIVYQMILKPDVQIVFNGWCLSCSKCRSTATIHHSKIASLNKALTFQAKLNSNLKFCFINFKLYI